VCVRERAFMCVLMFRCCAALSPFLLLPICRCMSVSVSVYVCVYACVCACACPCVCARLCGCACVCVCVCVFPRLCGAIVFSLILKGTLFLCIVFHFEKKGAIVSFLRQKQCLSRIYSSFSPPYFPIFNWLDVRVSFSTAVHPEKNHSLSGNHFLSSSIHLFSFTILSFLPAVYPEAKSVLVTNPFFCFPEFF